MSITIWNKAYNYNSPQSILALPKLKETFSKISLNFDVVVSCLKVHITAAF